MDIRLDGRRAVVTGGTKGIGRGVVAEFLASGADVVFCARNAEDVKQTEATLVTEHPGRVVRGVVADVTDAASIQSLMADAADALRGIDVLVNNAGAAHPGTFEMLSDDDWHADLDVKLFSQIRATRAALPHLRRSSAPRVINVNAVYARYPDPAFFATTVNRAACLNLTKALAQQYGPENILVNSVNIGFVVTAQWDNIHQRRAPELGKDEFFTSLAAAEVPLGRFGTVDEVSGLITFLASDRGSYITGASIDVAGGMGKYV
ncbi:MAG TPA: SDR family oxidoreductase [Jatrophihabitans sp.]|nr:SDR family oxidoreductase [Jatrophihabitans sp.]